MAFASHSFHVFVPDILKEMVEAAGIKGHVRVAQSCDRRLEGRAALGRAGRPEHGQEGIATGKVDVLSIAPIHLPDDGIEKFTELALKYNPDIRVLVQEFWLRWDILRADNQDPGQSGSQRHQRRGAVEAARAVFQGHGRPYPGVEQEIRQAGAICRPRRAGRHRAAQKIIAGQAPGLKKQSDLFVDDLGHGNQAAGGLGRLLPFRRDLSPQPGGTAGALQVDKLEGSPEITCQVESAVARVGLAGGHPASAQRPPGGRATVATPFRLTSSRPRGCSPTDASNADIRWR